MLQNSDTRRDLKIVPPKGKRMKLTTAQIGKCGELYCQFRLLQLGIESAPMTTDSGIDLVAYSAGRKVSFTIQVKTCHQSTPGGGRGRMSIGWWIPTDCPADYVALVDIQTSRVWLFTLPEITDFAQQKPASRLHFFMMTDPSASHRKDGKLHHDYDFQKYLLENAAPRHGI
jgi:hypothetical protein